MEINQIINLSRHCLHLCTSANIEEIVFSCIMEADAFVTLNSEFWKKKFQDYQINCQIKKPDAVNPEEKIVVDGSSLGEEFNKWEKKWEKQPRVVCIYNIDKLNPSLIEELVKRHDRMIMSINKIKMVSDKHLEREINNLDPELVEDIVKKELNNLILSLLLTQPMCGIELVKILYQKFKVFISPGMLYPTLHELEKKGLLKYEYKLKSKVYSVKEREQAKNLLETRAKVNSLFSKLLGG